MMDIKAMLFLCIVLMLSGADLKVELIKASVFEAQNVEFVIHSIMSSMK